MGKKKDIVILAIETATSLCSVALLQGFQVISEISKPTERKHNETLPGLVEKVLVNASCKITDIDRIAISIGPGSFTGLRVGLSYAKGLAIAVGAEIIPVVTLDSIAFGLYHQISKFNWIKADELSYCPMIVAHKNEVFCKISRLVNNNFKTETEVYLGNAVQIAAQLKPGSLLGGEGADTIVSELMGITKTEFINLSEVREQISDYKNKYLLYPEYKIKASDAGILAYELLSADGGYGQSNHELEPLYLKEFTIRTKRDLNKSRQKVR